MDKILYQLEFIEFLDKVEKEISIKYGNTETGLTLDYEWSDDKPNFVLVRYDYWGYEESSHSTYRITFTDENIQVKYYDEGYSCEGGDYEDAEELTFNNYEDFLKYIDITS